MHSLITKTENSRQLSSCINDLITTADKAIASHFNKLKK